MAIDIKQMTVIIEDSFVSVNSVGYIGVDCSSAPSDIRAMQWYGNTGEEEMAYEPPNSPEPNRKINNLDAYQAIISNWELANNPPPPPPPTPEEVTTLTMSRASGSLASASYYSAPGVWDNIVPDSQYALKEWASSVTDILTKAQKILIDGTGEAYNPTFPPYPTINPAPKVGEGFTIYFSEPSKKVK
jgi:hypothetical protein